MYLNEWSSKEDVIKDFWPSYEYIKYEGQLEHINVLLASYLAEGCEGDAFVLFERDRELYEVSGGHCSCHGLEGQWKPEKTSVAELRHRLVQGTLGQYCSYPERDVFKTALAKVLDILDTARELVE